MPDRIALLQKWLSEELNLSSFELAIASDDASFRRYFRITLPDGGVYIVMDAPPIQEDIVPFISVAEMLQPIGLHVPKIFGKNIEQGFLLLEDLGTLHYQDVLSDQRSDELYGQAMDALLNLQMSSASFDLPAYGEKLLRSEMTLFPDWLLGRYLALELSGDDARMLKDVIDLLVDNALAQPRVPVLRDYHCRNLLVVDQNNPGIIDFQDAVIGPITYDLVSLLKDCYVQWPRDRVLQWVSSFYDKQKSCGGLHGITETQFVRWFDLMGVQRHLKASGIFARLNLRDGKSGYLKDIPRTLSYIDELGGMYPEIAPLADLIRLRVLPRLKG